MYNNLFTYFCDELEEYDRKVEKGGDLSKAETEYVKVLMSIKEKMLHSDKLMNEEGYSNTGYSRNEGHFYGNSYARRRDSRGRYASRGYSMDDGMIDELHELRDKAPDEQTRKEFDRFIRKVESM